MKKYLFFATAFAIGAWNAALVGSVSCTLLGFIWGFEETWQRVVMSLPLCGLVYWGSHKLVSKMLCNPGRWSSFWNGR